MSIQIFHFLIGLFFGIELFKFFTYFGYLDISLPDRTWPPIYKPKGTWLEYLWIPTKMHKDYKCITHGGQHCWHLSFLLFILPVYKLLNYFLSTLNPLVPLALLCWDSCKPLFCFAGWLHFILCRLGAMGLWRREDWEGGEGRRTCSFLFVHREFPVLFFDVSCEYHPSIISSPSYQQCPLMAIAKSS